MPRHNCGKGGWAECVKCGRRIHMDGCTSRRDARRDCDMTCLPDANIKRVLAAVDESYFQHEVTYWPNDEVHDQYWIGDPGDSSVGLFPQAFTPAFGSIAELDAYCAEHYAEIVAQWGDVAEDA